MERQAGRTDEERSLAGDPRALVFGSYAPAYERHRPTYPTAAVQWLLEPVGPSARVVDLGAGTGKLSRSIAAAGHRAVAVDPDPLMLEELRQAVPGVPTLLGSAEVLPLPDGEADAVLVGQAWHWMHGGRAAPELARVIRPGGVLGLVWNVRDRDDPGQAELSTLAHALDAGSRSDVVATTVPDPRFGAAEQRIVDNTVLCTVAELVGLASTWSFVATSADPTALLTRVAEIGRAWADPQGRFRYAQFTRCHRFRRAG